MMSMDDGKNKYCVWKDVSRKGKDWFEPSCQGHPVNPLNVASRRGITVVELFKGCPFCRRPIVTLLKDGKRLVPAK